MKKREFVTFFVLIYIFSSILVSINNVKIEEIGITTFASENGEKILFPRQLQPVIKLNGETFSIHVSASEESDSWEARVFTQYSEFSLGLSNIQYDSDEGVWILQASITSDLPEDLYDIKVKFVEDENQNTLVERNALQVLEEFPESFNMIQVSDTHIVVGATFRIEKFSQAIQQINLIQPPFVLVTGDLVEGGSVLQYDNFKSICDDLQVPMFALPGNHDVSGGTTAYAEEISSLYYTFEFGDAFVVMACTFGDASFGATQLEWIEDQLSSNQQCDLKVVAFHHPVWDYGTWDPYLQEASEFIEICEDQNVDLVLYGHLHNDDVRTLGETSYVLTTAVSGAVWAGNVHGYRIIEIENYNVGDFIYSGENLSQPLEGIQVERVPAEVRTLDKGLRLTVTNDLTYPLENLKLKAVLEPLVDDDYVVTNANTTSMIKSSDCWVVNAEFDVPLDSTVEVLVHPSNPSSPIIESVSYPSQIEDSESFKVEAIIENEVSGVESVDLYYTIDDLEMLHRESAEYSETDSYSIRVPSQPSGSKSLEFYIIARDFSGLETRSETYTVIIGEGGGDPSAGIPGYPFESLLLGIALAVAAITIIRKKESFTT